MPDVIFSCHGVRGGVGQARENVIPARPHKGLVSEMNLALSEGVGDGFDIPEPHRRSLAIPACAASHGGVG